MLIGTAWQCWIMSSTLLAFICGSKEQGSFSCQKTAVWFLALLKCNYFVIWSSSYVSLQQAGNRSSQCWCKGQVRVSGKTSRTKSQTENLQQPPALKTLEHRLVNVSSVPKTYWSFVGFLVYIQMKFPNGCYFSWKYYNDFLFFFLIWKCLSKKIFEMFNKLKMTFSTNFYGFNKLGFSGENMFHWKDPS